jgi:predicted polyphosphate/ATP-dependent NAD kinase
LKKLGLIVNPVAGMGGRVGLKGTDGKDILEKAKKLGAKEEAPSKTINCLKKLESLKDSLLIITCSGDMGQIESEKCGFKTKIVLEVEENNTTQEDTRLAAEKMLKEDVDLLMFVGGDGTARDIYNVVKDKLVVLGVPAGVKIHSPVYANTPEKAGELALIYLQGEKVFVKEEEVVDIDEDAFRDDIVSTRLYGYLNVPFKKNFMQNKKAPTPLNEEQSQRAIALDIIDHMEEDVYYIIGPGTTTRAVMTTLELPYTLLGVDIVLNKRIVKLDATEKEILEYIEDSPGRLIITPTGGQGYLIGRGNQQISSDVLRKIGKENIIVISANGKIINLQGKPLIIYTGNKEVDSMLRGYYRIKVGYGQDIMYPIETYY